MYYFSYMNLRDLGFLGLGAAITTAVISIITVASQYTPE